MQWSDVVARPSPKVLRQFAVLCLIVFGIMAAIGLWRGQGITIPVAIALAGIAVGLVGVVQPAAIRWIYSGWMIAVFPIGWTISRLMLAALFYLVFTPVALVFRLIRRDALHLRRQNARSHWTPKAGATSVDQYFRQF
ncbi:MAG TPA: SxtJ family membrane protein [Vicinamibacterales bacterium]|nr:SxtJ family membrane protein [Vicinamibacterales bacterium]